MHEENTIPLYANIKLQKNLEGKQLNPLAKQ
jgi:hypothetical protein